MLTVAAILAVIFLLRDLQILVVSNGRLLATRFCTYAILLLIGLTIFAALTGADPARTPRLFALGAIVMQLAELALGVALHRYALGRYSWLGSVLPAPAFLMGLYILGCALRDRLPVTGIGGALEIVAATWLLLVGTLGLVLYRMKNPWEDRRFAREFAMMSSCTALIFVAFWLS